MRQVIASEMMEYEKRMTQRNKQAIFEIKSTSSTMKSTEPNTAVKYMDSSAHLVPMIYPSLQANGSSMKESANSCVDVISTADKKKSVCSFCGRSYVSLKTHWSKSPCGKLANKA
jgi:hypothetical protein